MRRVRGCRRERVPAFRGRAGRPPVEAVADVLLDGTRRVSTARRTASTAIGERWCRCRRESVLSFRGHAGRPPVESVAEVLLDGSRGLSTAPGTASTAIGERKGGDWRAGLVWQRAGGLYANRCVFEPFLFKIVYRGWGKSALLNRGWGCLAALNTEWMWIVGFCVCTVLMF